MGSPCAPDFACQNYCKNVSDVVERWNALPRRMYLDTALLQDMWDYGEFLWDGGPFVPLGRGGSRPGLVDDLDALRLILAVNQRAAFQFVVSHASIAEVDRRANSGAFRQWVLDVLDVWLVQSEGWVFRGVAADGLRGIGSLSTSDRRVLQDALDNDCDALLTMDKKLVSQHSVVRRAAGLSLLSPDGYWRILQPFAALFL